MSQEHRSLCEKLSEDPIYAKYICAWINAFEVKNWPVGCIRHWHLLHAADFAVFTTQNPLPL